MYRYDVILRTAGMTAGTRKVRNQRASNEPQRPAGQPWERLTPGTEVFPPAISLLQIFVDLVCFHEGGEAYCLYEQQERVFDFFIGGSGLTRFLDMRLQREMMT